MVLSSRFEDPNDAPKVKSTRITPGDRSIAQSPAVLSCSSGQRWDQCRWARRAKRGPLRRITGDVISCHRRLGCSNICIGWCTGTGNAETHAPPITHTPKKRGAWICLISALRHNKPRLKRPHRASAVGAGRVSTWRGERGEEGRFGSCGEPKRAVCLQQVSGPECTPPSPHPPPPHYTHIHTRVDTVALSLDEPFGTDHFWEK